MSDAKTEVKRLQMTMFFKRDFKKKLRDQVKEVDQLLRDKVPPSPHFSSSIDIAPLWYCCGQPSIRIILVIP